MWSCTGCPDRRALGRDKVRRSPSSRTPHAARRQARTRQAKPRRARRRRDERPAAPRGKPRNTRTRGADRPAGRTRLRDGSRVRQPALLRRFSHRPDASSFRAVEEAPSRAKALLLLLPGGVAAGLGAWQLQRREWKVEQLAERAQQLAAEPLPLAAVAAAGGAPAGEWRRVLCKGELRHDAAAYVRHPAAPADAPLRQNSSLTRMPRACGRRWGRACAPSAAPRTPATCWCAYLRQVVPFALSL